MNLYNLHTNPEGLLWSEEQYKVPSLAWNIIEEAYLKGNDYQQYLKYIKKSPEFAYEYASFILGGERWPEAEPYIIKDPICAQAYAQNILESRWPEAEKYIIKDPSAAAFYTFWTLKERWLEAEPVIMRDPDSASRYADVIFESRWLEAEKYIKQDKNIWADYKDQWDIDEPI